VEHTHRHKKSILAFAAGGCVFLPLTGFGQFVDDEASAKLLAVQCKVSFGFAGGEYDEYGNKLVKTLSHLSAAQQERCLDT